MTDEEWEEWFEGIWEYRETTLYEELFGEPDSENIYALTESIFRDSFDIQEFDPLWFHHGVILFKPTPKRQSWVYVTSGLSNAWTAEGPEHDAVSGAGIELVFETTERVGWAVKLLQEMLALAILTGGTNDALDVHQIVPAARLLPEGSTLSALLTGTPTRFPAIAQLETGLFRFVQLTGITADEAEYGRTHGPAALQALLEHRGGYPVTDPKRKSAL